MLSDVQKKKIEPKGLVIIYDQGGAESNDFLRKIFSWPTRRAKKKILNVAWKIFDAYSYR